MPDRQRGSTCQEKLCLCGGCALAVHGRSCCLMQSAYEGSAAGLWGVAGCVLAACSGLLLLEAERSESIPCP